MSAFKRPGSETFSYDFQLKGGRFHGSTGCTTKREADAWEKRFKEKLKSEQIDLSKPMTFGTAMTLWWDQVGQHLANYKDQERYLAWLQTEIGLKTLLRKITDISVSILVAKRRKDGVSNATINRSIAPLRQILIRARKTWKVDAPEIEWKQHMMKEAKGKVRVVSRASEDILVDKTRDDYAVPLRFAYLSGCRRMEIVGLGWIDVSFPARTFTVTGKRGRARTVPMTEAIYQMLWALKDNHPEAVFTYVAINTRIEPRSGRKIIRGEHYPITMAGFKSEWGRMKIREGVQGVRFHDSRHTAATRVYRATGDLGVVQKMLGHAAITTTAIYAEADIEDVLLAMEATTGSTTQENVDRGKILEFNRKIK